MRDSETLSSASERLEFIDSLRGFSLFGVFWANLLIFSVESVGRLARFRNT